MKTVRLIGMAFLAIVMCVNLTACSNDDDPTQNDDGIITNQKKLMQIKMVDSGESIITEYTYDSNGRLVSAMHTEQYDGKEYTSTYTITWGANKIIESRNGKATTYTFEDGLITHTSGKDGGDLDNTDFTYNGHNQLVKLQYNENEYISYTWQSEKLTKMTWHEQYNDDSDEELSYSGKTCKGYLPIMVWCVDDLHPLLEAHPELVGMRCNQLPDQISEKNDSYESIDKCTYTFDKDGYIESCTVELTYKHLDINETRTETTIYTFTWE